MSMRYFVSINNTNLFFRLQKFTEFRRTITHKIMVVRDLEALETYHDQDNANGQLYVKDSYTAEDFGYAVVLTTFILIVLLVCFVGLGITSPCCCRGTPVTLHSVDYSKESCDVEIAKRKV